MAGFRIDIIQEFLNDEKNRVYVTVGVTVLTVALYVMFAGVPKAIEFYEATSATGALKRNIAFVNREGKRFDKLNERFEKLKAEDDRFSKLFFNRRDVPQLLEEVASIARKCDVNMRSITPYEKKKLAKSVKGRTGTRKAVKKEKKYFNEMPILITAKSGYHQLAHFINDLEEGGRLITIEDVQIQADKKDPWRHNARISLKAYVLIEGEK